jgi:hypothetical protein
MRELTQRHHQMMWLVAALHHYSHKAKCFELGQRLCLARHDREPNTVWQLFALRIPANLAQLVCVRWNHALDRFQGAVFASYCYLDTVLEVALRGRGVQSDLVHVDQMLS